MIGCNRVPTPGTLNLAIYGTTLLAMRASKAAQTMQIRQARNDDSTAIAEIIIPFLREGTTYPIDTDIPEKEALTYWLAADKETFVAEVEGAIVGTYYIRPNNLGGGRHVCNCGYMTSHRATGRGVGRRMCEHSLEYARSRGYRAMQFNFVISTNDRAVRLWRGMGFEIVGRRKRFAIQSTDTWTHTSCIIAHELNAEAQARR
jgi:ribosomal protein S18 acetylase RimI-like enzyme